MNILDFSLRDLLPYLPPNTIHYFYDRVYLDINSLLKVDGLAITVDSPIASDIIATLLRAYYIAQANYNAANPPKKIQAVNLRFNSPAANRENVTAQLNFEFNVYGTLDLDNITPYR